VRACAVLLAAGTLAACAPAAVGPLVHGAPRAVPLAAAHDFGEVPPGARVEHRFEIVNRGDRVLEIRPAESSCGCRASLAAADSVAPGESGGVTLTLEADRDPGPKVAWVRIETNDPLDPELRLVLRGRVAGDVRVEPERVFLGRVRPNQSGSATVEVRLESPAVGISSVRSSSDRLRVKAERLAAPERGVRLRVTLPPQGIRGRINDRIIVATTSKLQPKVEIPVFASVE
jgi:hypothetical protein